MLTDQEVLWRSACPLYRFRLADFMWSVWITLCSLFIFWYECRYDWRRIWFLGRLYAIGILRIWWVQHLKGEVLTRWGEKTVRFDHPEHFEDLRVVILHYRSHWSHGVTAMDCLDAYGVLIHQLNASNALMISFDFKHKRWWWTILNIVSAYCAMNFVCSISILFYVRWDWWFICLLWFYFHYIAFIIAKNSRYELKLKIYIQIGVCGFHRPCQPVAPMSQPLSALLPLSCSCRWLTQGSGLMCPYWMG